MAGQFGNDASCDAVVVGAGPGGCVMAARLAESGRRVTLIEAGPGEPRPTSVAGIDIVAAAEEQTRQWSDTAAVADRNGGAYHYRQGFGLGGGSMINAMLLSPGDRSDYRRWEEQHRCAGWGPDDMAPWLSRAATAIAGQSVEPGPLTEGFGVAAAAAGHPVGGSTLDGDRLGWLTARLAATGGRRHSAVDAYLRPWLPWDNPTSTLTVLTDNPVERILLDGERAVGVALGDGTTIGAPLVVVSAGAVRTPGLLRRSGLTARPVGARLKDHPSFAFTVALRSPTPGAPRTVSRVLRFSSDRDRSGDLQAFVVDRVDGGSYGVVIVGLMRVSGSGSILDAADGDDALDVTAGAGGRPMIETGAAAPDDRRRLANAVQLVGETLESPELRPLIERVFIDDRGTEAATLRTMSAAHIERWIGDHPGPYAHPAGSCPMGPEAAAGSVVASEPERAGSLLGYRGIHLADGSILPDLVQGGLQLPIAAVAERVAAGIVADS